MHNIPQTASSFEQRQHITSLERQPNINCHPHAHNTEKNTPENIEFQFRFHVGCRAHVALPIKHLHVVVLFSKSVCTRTNKTDTNRTQLRIYKYDSKHMHAHGQQQRQRQRRQQICTTSQDATLHPRRFDQTHIGFM